MVLFIADGVAQFYGKHALPESTRKLGIDIIEWIMIHHEDLEEAVDRSIKRLARSGKSRSSKKETTREGKMKTLEGANKAALRLADKFNEQKSGLDRITMLSASSPVDSITKLIGETHENL